MAFQPVPDTAKIEVVYAAHGRIQVNTFHASKGGGYLEADLVELAGIADDWVASEVLAYLTTEQSYLFTRVTGLNEEFDIQVEEPAGAGPGVVTATLFPANVSKAFTLRSRFTGRSARGRIYYPTLHSGEVQTDENLCNTTFLDQFVASLEVLRAAILAGGWTPVIVSRFHNGIKRAEGLTFVWNSTGYSSITTDSMRGRLPPP